MHLSISLALALLLAGIASAQAAPWRVVVLANSIDGGSAVGLYASLERAGVEVVKTDAGAFDAVKTAPYVVVLGGQNSPGGVGDVVSVMLSGRAYLSVKD